MNGNNNTWKNEVWPCFIALILAFGTIVLIKKVLLPSLGAPSNALNEIWPLEVAILLAIIGSFVFKEVLEGILVLMRARKDEHIHLSFDAKGSFVLLLAFSASIAIYLYTSQYLVGK